MTKKRLFLILDQLFILVAIWLSTLIKGEPLLEALVNRFPNNAILWVALVCFGLVFGKYDIPRSSSLRKDALRILWANFAFAGTVSLVLLFFAEMIGSRALFFGTLGFATLFELVFVVMMRIFREAKVIDDGHTAQTACREQATGPKETTVAEEAPETTAASKKDVQERSFVSRHGQIIKQSVLEQTGEEVFAFLNRHHTLDDDSIVLSVNNRLNILTLPTKCITKIINLEKVNNHRYVNKFFETVNFKLPPGGLYAGCALPQSVRKKRFMRRFTPVLGVPLYTVDFLIHRVMPKLPVSRKVYFFMTKGKKRVMSRAEILGRLYSCGFEVADEKVIGDQMVFIARKIRNPYYDNNPTYGPLIRLNRVGKDGRMIGVYKMRTMHPYAEYLQEYVHKVNALDEKGKFEDDFRISTAGKIMRKLWIDELPTLINWLKGEMKLVGVRPLSRHYFSLYNKELQEKRCRHTPGLVPPYYADMPETFEEIMESEKRYLDAYEKHPLRTDWKYFWKAFVNIVFRNARSG